VIKLELFRLEKYAGRLLSAEPDEKSRYRYIIWFPYTRELINEIQEGDLLAVPNFQSTRGQTTYSILKVTNILPKHFALRGRKDTESYPGYVMEAAKNIAASWTTQEKEPLEDTTIIEIEAIPSNLQFQGGSNDPQLEEERSLPMVGEEVKILSQEFTTRVINNRIKPEYEDIIEIGHLIHDENIKVFLRVEDLIRTHIGVFGFTGVGKSNLLSTLVRKLLTEKVKQDFSVEPIVRNIKILLFDLMDEYTSILIDLLVNDEINAKIVFIDRQSLPGPTFGYLNKKQENIETALDAFLTQMHMPKSLVSLRNTKYREAIKKLMEKGRIKIYEEEIVTVEDMINSIWGEIVAGLRSRTKINLLDRFKEDVFAPFDRPLTTELIDEFLGRLGARGIRTRTTDSIEAVFKQEDLKGRVDLLIPHLERMKEKLQNRLVEEVKITVSEILSDLGKTGEASLYIITSADPNKVREFAWFLGDKLYNQRRLSGTSAPLVLFLFDEADEIIPQQPYMYHPESQKLSKQIVETIARRGRKFGIGVGISTQRSAYLDTNIMGQLHTYFISKLPREYDRNAVADAFGLPQSEMIQTFKFRKGEWLLVSHEATGIESVPFPIYVENAEARVKEFLEGIE